MRLLVRGTGAEAATTEALVAAVRAEDAQLALDPPETLAGTRVAARPPNRGSAAGWWPRLRRRRSAWRCSASTAWSATPSPGRTREIATRLALGATPAAMRAAVLREGLALTGAGLAVGLVLAAALGRLIEGLLYETAPLDPAVTGLLVTLMALAAVVACYLPARRAMRVAPAEALRAE